MEVSSADKATVTNNADKQNWEGYPDLSIIQVPLKIKELSQRGVIKSSVRIYNEQTKIVRIRTTEGEIILKSLDPYEPGAYVALQGRMENGKFCLYVAQEQLEEGMLEGPLGEFIKFQTHILEAEKPQAPSIPPSLSKYEIYVGSELIKLDSPMFKLIGLLSGGGKEFFIRQNFTEEDLLAVPSLLSGRFIEMMGEMMKSQLEAFDDYENPKKPESAVLDTLGEITRAFKDAKWNLFLVPYVLKNDIKFLRMYSKKFDLTEEAESRRAVFEFDFNRLGRCKVDAMYNIRRKSMMLKMLTEQEIPPALEKIVRFAFDSITHSMNSYGSITFGELRSSEASPITEILDHYCSNRVGDFFA